MIPDFKLDENLVVEFLVPDPLSPIFVLGISILGGNDELGGLVAFTINESLLGGTDVLSDGITAFGWSDANCVVSRVDITQGGTIQDSLYFQPEPSTASLTLQSFAFDPTVNSNIRANTKIRVRVTGPQIDRTIFQGYIDTINVTYYVNDLNLIQIQAVDIYKDLVNTRIPTFDTTGSPFGWVTPLEVFEELSATTGIALNSQSKPLIEVRIPEQLSTDVGASEIINSTIASSLGVVWIDQDTEELVVQPRPTSQEGTATTFTIGNNHPSTPSADPFHLCLSEISVFSDADSVFNSLSLSLESDPETIVIRTDPDLIGLYGQSSIALELNLFDSTDLEAWADSVFFQTPTKLVRSVTTPAVDRLGTLTPASVITPGTLLGVSYITDQLNIVGYYSVVKARHSISSDIWLTTFELWKEV